MATRNIVPQNDNEGELGIQEKVWSKAHIKEINSENINTDTVETKNMVFNNMEIDFYFLKRNTVYKVDDIAYTKNAKNGIRLECVQGGTTASTEPIGYTTATVGSYVTDGSTKWIICDIKDGLSYGDIITRPILKTGYVKLNGATVQRADYPRLVKYATDNNLWTSSPSTEVWKFGQGDGRTTFVLPDYRNLFIEGGDAPAKIEAGLPNIQGTFYTNDTASLFWTGAKGTTGAFSMASDTRNIFSGTGVSSAPTITTVGFNASTSNAIYGKSTTVQPPAIALIPQIKY